MKEIYFSSHKLLKQRSTSFWSQGILGVKSYNKAQNIYNKTCCCKSLVYIIPVEDTTCFQVQTQNIIILDLGQALIKTLVKITNPV
jgi:hypothetical protein